MNEGRDALRRRNFVWLAGAAIVLHIGVAIARLRGNYFFGDDFDHYLFVHGGADLPSILFANVSGQYVPLYRLTQILFFRLAGLNYPVSEGILVALSSAAVLLIAVIAYRARTPLAVAAAILATAAVSWMPFEAQSWWSAAIHVLPGTLAMLGCVAIAATPALALGHGRSFLLALVYVVGLGFYAKVLVVIALCAGVRLFVRRSLERRALLQQIVAVVIDLMPMIAVAIIYVALIKLLAPMSVPKDGKTLIIVADFVRAGFQHGFLPGLVGLKIEYFVSAPWMMTVFPAVGGAALLIVILAGFRRSPQTIWLWIGLVATIAAGHAAIGINRAPAWGNLIAVIGRYNSDYVMLAMGLAAIVAGLAYAPSAGQVPSVGVRLPGAVASLAAVLICAANFLTFHYLVPPPGGVAVGQFAGRFQRSYAAALRSGPVTLANRAVPMLVLPRLGGQASELRTTAGILAIPAPVVTSFGEATHLMMDDGQVIRIDDMPTQAFRDPAGGTVTVTMTPGFEGAGGVDPISQGGEGARSGWVSPLLGEPRKIVVVAVSDCAIAGRAQIGGLRSDLAYFNTLPGDVAHSGFDLQLGPGSKAAVSILALVDGKIAVPLSMPEGGLHCAPAR